MIICLVEKLGNGDEAHSFGGIACDVEGCDAYEPQRRDSLKNLHEEGWFIAPGRHRCPKHFHEDVPGKPLENRYADKTTKRL